MDQPQSTPPLTEYLAKLGATITFVPREAHLSITARCESEATRTRSIHMRVDLEQGEDVRLPNNRSLKPLPWSVYVFEGAKFNDATEKEGALGGLSHFGERKDVDNYFPEACEISAALDLDKFSALLDAVQSGHLPDKIHVTARGLSYGREPDGAGKIWDMEKTPNPLITEIRFRVPLAVRRKGPSDPLDETAKTDGLPATAGDLRSLERKVATSLSELRHDNSSRWAILFALLVFVIVLIYFRR